MSNRNDKTTMELLDDIIKKVGPYSRDQLTHANNALENASQNATIIKQRIEEAIGYINATYRLYSSEYQEECEIQIELREILTILTPKEGPK